jgi:hypothetical protein
MRKNRGTRALSGSTSASRRSASSEAAFNYGGAVISTV